MISKSISSGFLTVLVCLPFAACSSGGGGGSQPTTLNLTSPAGSEQWAATQLIEWTSNNEKGDVRIDISSDSGTTYSTVATVLNADESYSWDTSSLADGSMYRLRIVPIDSKGNEGTAIESADFVLDNTAPAVTLTTPIGGEVLTGSSAVSWTTTDANPGMVEILLSSDSGATFPTTLANISDTGSYTWDTYGYPTAKTYRLRVTVTDGAGNSGNSFESATDFQLFHAPVLAGTSEYTDANQSGSADAGDTLVVSFSADVSVNGATDAAFAMAVSGDSLGSGASVAPGPASHQVTITLGTSPSLTTRLGFNTGSTAAGSPSGIAVSGAIATGVITSAQAGDDAQASIAVDIVSGFVRATQLIGNGQTQVVTHGDVDGDGTIDVICGVNGNANEVWNNNGSGTLTDSLQMLGMAGTQALALADVDRDGDLDLIEGNNGADAVWTNDGSGLFSDSGQSLGNASTTSLAIADLDRDGDLDFVAGVDGAGNTVWMNDGLGMFIDSAQSLGSGATRTIALGDVDSDGDLDIVVGNLGEADKVWTNDGMGVFSDSGQSLGMSRTRSVVLEDIDHDGDLDFVAGNAGEANLVWLNDGSGAFSDSGQTLGLSATRSLALGDIDNDGDTDLFEVNTGEADVLWMNDGSGVFTAGDFALDTGSGSAAGVADIDGDGDLDLLVGLSSGGIQPYVSSSSGGWGTLSFVDSGQSLTTSAQTFAPVADLDSDGDLDFIEVSISATNQIWLNDGTGVFSTSTSTPASPSSYDGVLGDLDADGDMDLVLANWGSPDDVFMNDGSGGFGAAPFQSLSLDSNYSTGSDLGDLDGDGDLDLVIARDMGLVVRFFDSMSGFGAPVTYAVTGSGTRGARLADFDGDHDLDVAVSGWSETRVFINDGTGTFADSGTSYAACWRPDLADYDLDGDVDMLIPAPSGTDVWINDGSGAFTASGQTLPAGGFGGNAVADIDGDGDKDLYLGQSGVDSLWLNDGNGVFTDSGLTFSATSGSTFPSSFADFNFDGDLDLVLSRTVGNSFVYVNL